MLLHISLMLSIKFHCLKTMSLKLKGSRCNFWWLRQNIKFTVVQLLCDLSPWQPHGNPIPPLLPVVILEVRNAGNCHNWQHAFLSETHSDHKSSTVAYTSTQHGCPPLTPSHLLHISNSFTDSSTLSTFIILNSFSPCPSMVTPLPVLVIPAVDSFPTEEYSWSDWTVLELTGPLVDAISSTTHEWPTKIMHIYFAELRSMYESIAVNEYIGTCTGKSGTVQPMHLLLTYNM